jgi:tetratricopeptide (TPR) repeat protein
MSRKNAIEVRAARAYRLKNYSLAIRHLKELLEHVGENPHTLHMLAECHARQNEDLQALAFARRALEADDRHLESLKLLARLLFLRGEHREARTFVARALADEPRRENAPTASRNWLATILAGRRALQARDPGSHVVDAAEHRRWLEWAEAYMAMPPERDDDAS